MKPRRANQTERYLAMPSTKLYYSRKQVCLDQAMLDRYKSRTLKANDCWTLANALIKVKGRDGALTIPLELPGMFTSRLRAARNFAVIGAFSSMTKCRWEQLGRVEPEWNMFSPPRSTRVQVWPLRKVSLRLPRKAITISSSMAWSGNEITGRIAKHFWLQVILISPGWTWPWSSSPAGAQLSSSPSHLRQVPPQTTNFSSTIKLSNCRDYSQGRTVADRFSMFGQSVIVQMSVSTQFLFFLPIWHKCCKIWHI